MSVTFSVDLINGGEGVIITNTSTGLTNNANHKYRLSFTGTLGGTIISYDLTTQQKADFIAKVPITLTASVLSGGKFVVFPDDFYRLQINAYEDLVIQWKSFISTLCSYSYVQKSIHDKIVHTERIIGGVEKVNIHAMVIHLDALEILGNNPPISMENTVVARLKYLKSI